MKTEKEKMLLGENYSATTKELIFDRIKTKKILHKINVSEYWMNKNTRKLIAELLPNSKNVVHIEPPFHCDYGYNIECGENVFFNVNCVVLDSMKVKIGSNVMFGPSVHIYTATHPLDKIERRDFESAKPVTIGDDCWIGGQVVICPGVIIGSGSVIGAGSVVTKDIPEDTLAVGNPAKIVRKLNGNQEL
ncbi:sugar O-acetyltransferase [Flavobacterium sp. SM2513]|uniref:sugar O-acetyltransferase n=1 Tax=Flavobacterium sp. SM2513 TaxID=3424766 RepID=UPI003D7FDE89